MPHSAKVVEPQASELHSNIDSAFLSHSVCGRLLPSELNFSCYCSASHLGSLQLVPVTVIRLSLISFGDCGGIPSIVWGL